ncbi:MAG: prepilin-type N-terminal cleavage/methylation domain-containing protein [Pararhodobacter sp.]|nr:prepilin-type N-terminal cleavage/methylation domain-containing protein [Pararhodobacter sp.]
MTDRASRRAKGFTLIELVAVTTIISVLSLTLIVGSRADSLFGRDRPDDPARIARSFAETIERARSQAFHSRLPYAILPQPEGWLLLQRDRDAGAWRSIGDGTAPGTAWVISGTVHFPTPLAPDTPLRPRILLASDGRITPFVAEFHTGQGRYRCQTDGWEALQCARP